MIILASASPRRHDLLIAAGIPHLVRPSYIPEERKAHEDPKAFVQRLAYEKGQSLLKTALNTAPNATQSGDSPPVSHTPVSNSRDIILSADTVVCVDQEVFGKPASLEDAARMLRTLSGRSHWVHTGICLHSDSRTIIDIGSTEVYFLPLPEETIKEYTRSGEYEDKAGAYAIQGRASRFVSKIHGCYQNVVGLPVSLVYRRLLELGWNDTTSDLSPQQ